MRVLGFLFLIVLVVAVVGVFRGWFTVVSTSHAGESKNVSVGVHTDRMREDAARVAELPERVASKVRAMSKSAGTDASEIEGTVTTADAAGRRLAVSSGGDTLELVVPATVRIERNGDSVGFDQLHAGARVRLRFRHDGDARSLERVEMFDR